MSSKFSPFGFVLDKFLKIINQEKRVIILVCATGCMLSPRVLKVHVSQAGLVLTLVMGLSGAGLFLCGSHSHVDD